MFLLQKILITKVVTKNKCVTRFCVSHDFLLKHHFIFVFLLTKTVILFLHFTSIVKSKFSLSAHIYQYLFATLLTRSNLLSWFTCVRVNSK